MDSPLVLLLRVKPHPTNLSLTISEAELPVSLNLSLNVLITSDLLMKSKASAFAGKESIACIRRNVLFWGGI